MEDCITIVSVNKCVVPHDQRRNQLAFLEDVFLKLLKFIIGQRGNLGLKLRVDFQVDHSHTPLSLLLRLFFLPEKGRNILLCGFQFEQFFLSFLVLLVELCLFGCQLRILSFQLFEVRQCPEPVGLEIGASGLVHSKLCTVLLLKGTQLSLVHIMSYMVHYSCRLFILHNLEYSCMNKDIKVSQLGELAISIYGSKNVLNHITNQSLESVGETLLTTANLFTLSNRIYQKALVCLYRWSNLEDVESQIRSEKAKCKEKKIKMNNQELLSRKSNCKS